MKRILNDLPAIVLFIILCGNQSYGQKDFKAELATLDELSISEEGLLFNNFSFRLDDNMIGGKTTEFRCSVKNKSQGKRAFALFAVGFDDKNQMVVAYSLRTMMFSIEPGKIEEVKESAISKGTERVAYFKIRVIVRDSRI